MKINLTSVYLYRIVRLATTQAYNQVIPGDLRDGV